MPKHLSDKSLETEFNFSGSPVQAQIVKSESDEGFQGAYDHDQLFLSMVDWKDGFGQTTLQFTGLTIEVDTGNSIYSQIHDGRPGVQPNELVEVKNVIFACDTLIIRAPIRAAERNVTIFARRVWIDIDNMGDTPAIDTSPLPWAQDRAPRATSDSAVAATKRNGADGRTAGTLSVFVKELGDINGDALASDAVVFRSDGGTGQGAGFGMNGAHGKNVPSWDKFSDYKTVNPKSWVIKKSKSYATCTFSKPATRVRIDWYRRIRDTPSVRHGSDDRPTNGKPAKWAGKPGEPGLAGDFYTNLSTSQADHFRARGGRCGAKGEDVSGGAAGTPTTWAQYDIWAFYAIYGDTYDDRINPAILEVKEVASGTTKAGAGATAPSADSEETSEGVFRNIDAPNAWLHPDQLETMQRYIRAVFLKDATSGEVHNLIEIVNQYIEALGGPVPDIDVWNEETVPLFSKKKAAFTSLQLKMQSGVDYYGNPIGFVPYFSLASTMDLVKKEVQRASAQLATAAYFKSMTRNAKIEASAMKQAQDLVYKQTKQAVSDLDDLDAKILEVEKGILEVQDDVVEAKDKLIAWENKKRFEVLDELQSEAEKMFYVQTLGVLLQVIPYGQPVTGMAGKAVTSYGRHKGDMGAFVADMSSKENLARLKASGEQVWGGIKTFKAERDKKKKLAAITTRTRGSASLHEYQATADRMEKERLKELAERFRQKRAENRIVVPGGDRAQGPAPRGAMPMALMAPMAPPLDGAGGKAEPDAGAKKAAVAEMGCDYGGALSDMWSAIQSTSVPASDVQAALEKLKLKDKEWNKLVKSVQKLAVLKEKTFARLQDVLHRIATISGDIQAGSLALIEIHESMQDTSKLANPALARIANEMEVHARDNLLYRLYLMTRAYEAVTFSPSSADWSLAGKVAEKLQEAAQTKTEIKLSEINALAGIIETAFKKIQAEVEDSLVRAAPSIKEDDSVVIVSMREDQIGDLNSVQQDRSTTVNFRDHGVLDLSWDRVRIAGVEIEDVEFGTGGDSAAAAEYVNAKISLHYDGQGLIRNRGDLMVVRSDPRVFSWTYDGRGWQAAKVSESTTDLFERLLGTSNAKMLSDPPAFSDFRISVSHKDGDFSLPLKSLKLKIRASHRTIKGQVPPVLDLRSEGADAAKIEVRNLFRKDRIKTVQSGFYYILDGRPTLSLTAEDGASGRGFSNWTLVTKHGKFTAPSAAISLPGSFAPASDPDGPAQDVDIRSMVRMIAHYE